MKLQLTAHEVLQASKEYSGFFLDSELKMLIGKNMQKVLAIEWFNHLLLATALLSFLSQRLGAPEQDRSSTSTLA